MPLALGRFLFFREVTHGHWIPVVAVVAVGLLLRFWPRIVVWFESRRR